MGFLPCWNTSISPVLTGRGVMSSMATLVRVANEAHPVKIPTISVKAMGSDFILFWYVDSGVVARCRGMSVGLLGFDSEEVCFRRAAINTVCRRCPGQKVGAAFERDGDLVRAWRQNERFVW